MRRIVHHFEKNNHNLTKERDLLKRDLLAEHRLAEETDGLFQESQHQIRSLKDSISQLELKHKKLKDDCIKLAKEKSKKLEDIQTLGDKIDALQSKVHHFIYFAINSN